ncbi:DUF4232 domain-containing protein [Micromonospora sp. NPDC005979]|uniref:DUF4232 domain-containing protein n=1 Tax=Micromonospora sp. NPDC005979 TaxID=3156726 RepID=UPI0033AC1BFE
MIFQNAVGRRVGAATMLVLALSACVPRDHAGQGGDPTGPPPKVTTAPSVSPSASVEPVAACPPSGVRIRSTGGDAAMGLRALGVELVNCGDRPYRLNGYPTVWVLDEQRKPIILAVVNWAKDITSGFDQPPQPITLQKGERAVASVLWRNLVTDSTVVATDGAYLSVAPAAGQQAQDVDPDGPVDVGNTGRIGVSAWRMPTT